MPETRALSRKIDLPPAADYAGLRAEGLSHIQQLSSEMWRQHSDVDAGITTLEILCYALTDLAYRTRLPTRDLLAGPDGRMAPASLAAIAPAHEVLTTAPRTLADYRRLGLAVHDVDNIWLDPMTDPTRTDNYRVSEKDLYADCDTDALSLRPTDGSHPVKLSGLYRVLVSLEIDDELGPLNETALIFRVRRGPMKGLTLSFDVADFDYRLLHLDASSLLDQAATQVASVSVLPGDQAGGFSANLTLTLSAGASLPLLAQINIVEARPKPGQAPLAPTTADIAALLGAVGPADLIPMFWRKQQRRRQALEAVACALHANRGLCEDYLSIATVAPFRVGICADIEVAPGADFEWVQARVFHEIETYLTPPVQFHSLQEMLDQGRQPDEIFNGPFFDFGLTCHGAPVFTKPGFITDEALAGSELLTAVQVSDIINLVVEIEGVEAIRDVQLRAYDRAGLPKRPGVKWTLAVPAGCQPVFYMEGSKLLFHRSGIPYRAQVTEFEHTLAHLRALARRDLYIAPGQVLPAPVGRWRDPAAIYSVQHDFPATYKIGPAGISSHETPLRIAQARQFKGYLTFFDQMLADYLGQLAGLRRLYSLDDLSSTWFSQFMTGIAGSREAFETEFYIDAATLADDVQRTRLNESEEIFQERRNRLLDHLIGLFAERFTDYALLTFDLTDDRPKSAAQLIAQKTEFLKAYPKLSRERGMGLNLRPGDPTQVWDSDNITGLEQRVGRLLGVRDVARRDLHCGDHFRALFSTSGVGGNTRVVIAGAAGEPLFTSQETFRSARSAWSAAADIYAQLRTEAAFGMATVRDGGATSLTIRSGRLTLTHAEDFATLLDATKAARAIVDRYDDLLEADCDVEGMHLIEHILLRPARTDDRLMRVCLDDECGFCGEEDPYSFRVSVVLPYWPKRFRNMHFRALFERTIREEAPAHVQVKICWIGQQQMIVFDQAYRAWLEARSQHDIVSAQVGQAARDLIDILESLTTVYPAASLHDCDAGENETIVRLGSTALGIF